MVYGQRTDRVGESRIKRNLTHLFYRVFARFGETTLPEGAGDFRLIDRRGVQVLKALGERARFSKGLYAWIGFKSAGVPFAVEERRFGTTKWSFRRLFRFAFDGITSFSTVPLRIWAISAGSCRSPPSRQPSTSRSGRCCSAPTLPATPRSSFPSPSSQASS